MRILLPLLILTIVACGQKKPAPQDAPSAAANAEPKPAAVPSFAGEAPTASVGREGKLGQVELRCGGNSCPPQVGVLLFDQNGAGKDFYRCTATLIAPDRIVTTGHCGYDPQSGFFVSGVGSALKKRRLRRLITRIYTPPPKSADESKQERELLRPALAVFELAEPITNVTPMTIASGPRRLYDRLTAYAVNEVVETDAKGNKVGLIFRLDNVTCLVRRHESIFPFDLKEAPELIYGFDCKLIGGNSGAAMVAPGSEEIQAIQQGVIEAKAFADSVRNQFAREPVEFEKHDWTVATNVRCLSWEDKPAADKCVKNGREEAGDRWIALQTEADAKMREREFSAPGSGLQFVASVTTLPPAPNTYMREYDVVYLPKCRERDLRVGETLQMPNELVRLDYDAWGEPGTRALKTRMIPARITSVDASGVIVSVTWPPLFGPVIAPKDHPSVRWGESFPIALPTCQGY